MGNPQIRRLAAFVSAAVALVFADSARCDDGVVVIAVNKEGCGMEPRIRAELDSTGFSTVEKNVGGGDSGYKALRDASRQAGAIAAIRCAVSRDRVEILVFDRTTGKALFREIPLSGDEPDADAVVAFRTVELLRASLMELSTRHQLEAEIQPTETVEELIKPSADEPKLMGSAEPGRSPFSGRFGVSPALLLTNFSGPPAVDILLDLQLQLTRWIAAELIGLAPIVPNKFDEDQGRVRVSQGFAGAGLRLYITAPQSRFVANAQAGGGAMFFNLIGQGETGFEGHEEFKATALPYLGSELAWQLSRQFRARLDIMAGWMVPSITVRVAESEIARLGHLVLVFGVGIEVRMWG